MYHADMSVADSCARPPTSGYEYLELSPRADWFFWHRYPKADDALNRRDEEGAAGDRREDSDAGAGVQLVVAGRAGTPAQVRNWRRLLEIADDLECPIVNSELSGDPNRPGRAPSTRSTRRWRNSIPNFEQYGIGLNLEAHPYDFSETNDDAVQNHPRPEQAVGELRVLRSARLPPLGRGGRHEADDGVRR